MLSLVANDFETNHNQLTSRRHQKFKPHLFFMILMNLWKINKLTQHSDIQ